MLKLKVGKLLEFSEEAPRAAVICLTPDLVTSGPQSQLCTDWDQRSNIQLWIFWRGSQGFLHQYLVSFLLTETIKSNVMLARKLLFLCWNLFAFHQVRWWQKSLGCIFFASKLEENHLDQDIPFRCQENHFLQFSITLIGKGWISKQFKCKKIFIPLHYLRRFKLQKYFLIDFDVVTKFANYTSPVCHISHYSICGRDPRSIELCAVLLQSSLSV